MFSAVYNRSGIRSWGSGGDSPNQILQQEVVNIYFGKSPLFLNFQKIWKIIKISVVSLVFKLPITTCIFWKTIERCICNVGGNMMGAPPEISIEWENVEIEVKVMGPHQQGGGYVR